MLLPKTVVLFLNCRNGEKQTTVGKIQRVIPMLYLISCDTTPLILVFQPFNGLARAKWEKV